MFKSTFFSVNSEGSRFWGGATSEDLAEIPVPDGAALLRTRVIEFTGTWEPVRHTCRAPLASGKLCPRQDREKVLNDIFTSYRIKNFTIEP